MLKAFWKTWIDDQAQDIAEYAVNACCNSDHRGGYDPVGRIERQ